MRTAPAWSPGLTRISDVHGYNVVDGRVVPDEGHLILRGYDIEDLIENAQKEDRFGYEEVAYLLIDRRAAHCQRTRRFNGRLARIVICRVSSCVSFPSPR